MTTEGGEEGSVGLRLSANFAQNECFYFGGYGFGQEVVKGNYCQNCHGGFESSQSSDWRSWSCILDGV
jgi:hypothetical protein